MPGNDKIAILLHLYRRRALAVRDRGIDLERKILWDTAVDEALALELKNRLNSGELSTISSDRTAHWGIDHRRQRRSLNKVFSHCS